MSIKPDKYWGKEVENNDHWYKPKVKEMCSSEIKNSNFLQ